jgi:geranylgeranyl pyrophosphate synthase
VKERLTTIDFLTPVHELILRVEDRMRAQANGHSSELAAALEHILASGGKRVRTAMILLAGGMLGGNTENLITLAAAVEMLHTATLVHDDLIDGSLLRRGNPTINAQWSPAATVLTGDFIFARAAKLAAETNSVAVMGMFADTLGIIVNGEINQLFEKNKLSSQDDYYKRIYAKTASMFELATGAAALLSPVPPSVVEAMSRYGYDIGMAFQIIDDVLDFTGEQTSMGKPVANDLRSGLLTLPALYYLEAQPDDPDLKTLFNGSNNHSEERLLRVVNAIRQSGAINRAMDEARRYVDRGLAHLAGMPNNPQRQSLEDLALYVVRRHR